MQHVSATFRKDSISNGAEAENFTKQVVLFKPEESVPAPGNDVHKDVKPSVGLDPDLKGLSIINQGHLTLHYHSYNEGSSSAYQPAIVPLKRTSTRSEDEQYSEALSSLMDIDLSPPSHPDTCHASKRQRIEEPGIEMVVEPDAQRPQKEVKEEEEPAQKPTKKKGILCKNCGKPFNRNHNKGSKQPCRYHSGMLTTPAHPVSQLSRSKVQDHSEYNTNSDQHGKEPSSTTLRA